MSKKRNATATGYSRALSRPTKKRMPTALCPCCNARKVLLHMLNNGDEIKTADNESVAYEIGNPETAAVVCEFGVLAVHSFTRPPRLIVTSFGDEVMHMTAGEVDLQHDGPWVQTLASIEKTLAQKFGPVTLPDAH